MYELKKNVKVFTSKFVGTGPSSYKKKRIYRAAVSQRLRNTVLGYQEVFSFARFLDRSQKFRSCYKVTVCTQAILVF